MNSYQLKGTFIIQVNEVSENTIAQFTPLLKTGEHWCTERRSFNSPTHFFVSASVLYTRTNLSIKSTVAVSGTPTPSLTLGRPPRPCGERELVVWDVHACLD